MSEMAPEQPTNMVEANGEVNEDGLIITVEIPNAQIVLAVRNEALGDRQWTNMVYAFPEAVGKVMAALDAKRIEVDGEDVIDGE